MPDRRLADRRQLSQADPAQRSSTTQKVDGLMVDFAALVEAQYAQRELLDRIEGKVDTTNDHLRTLNGRVVKTEAEIIRIQERAIGTAEEQVKASARNDRNIKTLGLIVSVGSGLVSLVTLATKFL